MAKVNKTDDCWVWTAGRTPKGYGAFYPHRRHQVAAHRWAYEHFVGPIPDGMYVLHSCDNPPCVNPDHLSVGTQRDNIQQCIERGRLTRANQKGAANPRARLTDDDVRAIRDDPRTATAIASDYDMGLTAISRIKRRQSWAHVT